MPGFDAIVLAGGAGRRLGGIDKPMAVVGGRAMLLRVLDAVAGAERRIVVGPVRAGVDGVTWCREDPPGAGPRAALATALPFVAGEIVLLVAADLPEIAGAVPVLLAAVADGSAGAAVLTDTGGRANYVAAAWRTAALRAAVHAAADPFSLRAVYAAADVVNVPDGNGWGADCDTPEDLEAARRKARS